MVYVSLAALGAGLLLIGFVAVSGFRNWAGQPPEAAGSGPQAPRKQGNRKEGNRKNRRDTSSVAGSGSGQKS